MVTYVSPFIRYGVDMLFHQCLHERLRLCAQYIHHIAVVNTTALDRTQSWTLDPDPGPGPQTRTQTRTPDLDWTTDPTLTPDLTQTLDPDPGPNLDRKETIPKECSNAVLI